MKKPNPQHLTISRDQACGILSPWLRLRRIKAVLPYLKGNILDYGCGIGALTAYCRPEQYLGIEIDPESLAMARTRHPDFRFSEMLVPSDRFDTIVLLAVIEHLPSPGKVLRELRDVLNINGRILLTTPHPLVAGVHHLGARIGLFSLEANHQHQSLLSYQSMKLLVQSVDMQIEKYRHFLAGANQLFVLRK